MKEYTGKTKQDELEYWEDRGRYWSNWANNSGYTSGGVAVGGGLFLGAGAGIILWSVLDISPWIIMGAAVAGLGMGLLLMAILVAASVHQTRKFSRKQ